jgi:hypothetical protein
MAEEFLKFSREKKRAILKGAEPSLGIKPYFLEKDIWICWALNELFTLPEKMAFKGGTSLSKCFGLIDRFSEDVDVTIDYREFMPDLDILKESKNALKNKREKLKEEINDYVVKTIIPMFEKAFAEQFSNEQLNYKFEAGERLYIYYPSVFERNADDYVKDNVLIEFGGTNKTEPSEESIVKPYLNIDGLIVPIAKVSVYSPARTFWEKVTLIHVECHRRRLTGAPERLSRHWYDLAKLSQSWVKANALQNKALLNDVLTVKKAFFNAGYANYDKCEKKDFLLIPNIEEIAKLKSDYAMMIESGMFLNEPVAFDDVIEELKSLQVVINKI